MRPRATVSFFLALFVLCSVFRVPRAAAQELLSLKQAISLALQKNPAVRAASAAEAEAGARLLQARSNYFPKINYAETFQRGNNPVYVFGTLLTQRRFGAANFALDALNRPDALNNFQSQVTVEQMVFDGQRSGLQVRAAHFGRQAVQEDTRRANMDTIHAVVRSYYAALLAAESARVAGEALKTAVANLRRAETLRDAGLTTDADVLSLRVHLAGVKEQEIRASNDLQVGKAALNDALGVPLDAEYALTSSLTPAGLPANSLDQYEREALERRPEARQALLAGKVAGVQADLARAAFLPQVVAHGAFESDRQTFGARTGTNWMAAISLRINLLNGFSDRARLAESAAAERRAAAERERAHSGIRLEVRRAYLDVRAADQRVEVARAAVAEAEESLRILQNRYEAGLANVTELLRSETALLTARNRHLAAVFDQRLAAVRLEQATGALTPESEALNP